MPALINFNSPSFDDPLSSGYRRAFWLIFLIGLALRLYAAIAGQGYHYFAIGDEILAYKVALGFLQGDPSAYYLGQPTFAGGHTPGPLWTLLWVGFYKLAGDSVPHASIIMALFNSLAIILVYRLAKHFLQPRFALFACLWFALAPWPIYHAAGMWNPMTLAVLGSILFLALHHVTQTDDSRWIILVCVMAAMLPQFHMIGIFYLPAILLLLWLAPARIHRGNFIIGCLLGFALYIPYLIGEITHHWSNLQQILSGKDSFDAGVLKILTAPLTVLSNHPGRWAGDDLNESLAFANRWFGSYIVLIVLNIISFAMALIAASFFIARFVGALRQARGSLRLAYQQHPQISFLGIILILPVLLFVLTGHNFSTRYTVIVFPLLFLLPAYYLQYAPHNRWRQFVSYTLPITLVANAYLPVAFFTQQHQQITAGDYLVCSFAKLESLRDSIKAHAGNDAFINIDTRPYSEHSEFEKLFIAGTALSGYMSVYETHLGHQDHAATVTKTYILARDSQTGINAAQIAWRGNGAIIYQAQTVSR